MKIVRTERVSLSSLRTNPIDATIRWSPTKSLWYSFHFGVSAFAVFRLFDPSAVSANGILTAVTLCCGHTVGLHRLLIHRNFSCSIWLERSLVYLGVLVGMGGPFAMIRMHDIRDWAQRHAQSHPFFTHQSGILRDWWWNLHCRAVLDHPPQLRIENSIAGDPFFRFLEKTWMIQQIPLAIVLFCLGGWSFVAWGISARIVMSTTGHWLIGYVAHNRGQRSWHLRGHSVQGYNLPGLGLITMGECWHNNHHAFPESARLGMSGQTDPGWWFIRLLEGLGLAWNLRIPEDLPARPERELLKVVSVESG